jgi:hypothetical protein
MNKKNKLVLAFTVVIYVLSAYGAYTVYSKSKELGKLPEPQHSFFTAQCSSAGFDIEVCACVEDKIYMLESKDMQRAIFLAVEACNKK